MELSYCSNKYRVSLCSARLIPKGLTRVVCSCASPSGHAVSDSDFLKFKESS
jgi:hypothetical protein